MDRRRVIEARRVLHRRARPFSQRGRRSRCRAAPARFRAVVVLHPGAPSVRTRAPRAGAGARPACRAGTAVGRAAGAGARIHQRRGAASGKTHRRRRLFSFRQAGAAQAASRRHLPQRSRQGAELAARQRWERLCDGLPARGLLQDARPAVPHRGIRRSPPSPEAQAQLRAASADAKGTKDPRAQIVCRQHLASDRQEDLPRHHPGTVQLYRSRGRRPAARQ